MKYGKEFQHILQDPHFPDEWRSSAIEYRQLKKLIKDVVAELSTMGLSPEVLHRLLVTEEDNPARDGSSTAAAIEIEAATKEAGLGSGPTHLSTRTPDDDMLEFEFESDEASPPTLLNRSTPLDSASVLAKPKAVLLDPILDESGFVDSGPSHTGPSSLEAKSSTAHRRKFRLRLLSDSKSAGSAEAHARPMSVSQMMTVQNQSVPFDGDVDQELDRDANARRRGRGKRIRKAVVGGQGVKAEYVVAGDASHPQPQIRLHLSTSPQSDLLTPHSPISPISPISDSDQDVLSSDEDTDDRHVPPSFSSVALENHLKKRPPTAPRPPAPDIGVIPPSPTLKRVQAAVSPIWALASGSNIEDGFKDLSIGNSVVEDQNQVVVSAHSELTSPSPPDLASSPAERDFVIPLASDQAFFNLLTAALTSLSAFHAAQQIAFRNAVEHLCTLISQSISPSSSSSSSTLKVLPTPLNPSDSTSLVPRGPDHGKTSKKDLYAWREIFTLWIEAEIFESAAERTRGERTIEQAEARLQKFAGEVVKRGLGDRRTMKGKKVKEAWDEFLRLNVLLLDLKRFQMANINAARKILKKHDKRTALTASTGFGAFVRSTLSSHIDLDGNVSTWTFYNTSLPHVLLASLTDTLLPLDDYSCLICYSIAFKPIRLVCSHLFCVRCLVKMQRAGKAECPLCRSKVVLLANKESLDLTLMNFMKEWFPKEVKEKQKDNEREVVKEQAEQAGMDTRLAASTKNYPKQTLKVKRRSSHQTSDRSSAQTSQPSPFRTVRLALKLTHIQTSISQDRTKRFVCFYGEMTEMPDDLEGPVSAWPWLRTLTGRLPEYTRTWFDSAADEGHPDRPIYHKNASWFQTYEVSLSEAEQDSIANLSMDEATVELCDRWLPGRGSTDGWRMGAGSRSVRYLGEVLDLESMLGNEEVGNVHLSRPP